MPGSISRCRSARRSAPRWRTRSDPVTSRGHARRHRSRASSTSFARFPEHAPGTTEQPQSGLVTGCAQRNLVRSVSAASMVLMKNEDSLLPFDLLRLAPVAIIGPNQATAHIMGGGSSQVRPHHRTSLLEAIRRRWARGRRADPRTRTDGTSQPTPLEPWESQRPGWPPRARRRVLRQPSSEENRRVQYGDEFRLQYLGPPGEGVPYPDFTARATATFTAWTVGTSRVRDEVHANTPADPPRTRGRGAGRGGDNDRLRPNCGSGSWERRTREGQRGPPVPSSSSIGSSTSTRTNQRLLPTTYTAERARDGGAAARDADVAVVVVGNVRH